MSIKKVLTTAFAMAAISSSISWGQTVTCSNGTSQKMGSAGGYDYELWSQNGAGSATMKLNVSDENGGAFEVEWQGTINMLARTGKRWGSNSSVTVQNVGNITSEFEVEWSSTDNVKYVSVYGWGYYDQADIPSGFSNEIEYYIVQDRGSYNPTQGGKKWGSATIDGISYDFYTTDRIQQPSLSGTSTFKQYWSIPSNTSQHRTKGTISISKHFSEWAKAGMKMGKLYEVASMKIESYTGNTGTAKGYAKVKKNLLKIGGSADELALNVTASPAAAGTVTKSPSANYYAPKSTVQLTAKANEGWKFVGWEGGATGSTETISVTMDKEKSVVAKFELVGETSVNLLKDGNFPSGSVISTSNDASWFLGQGTNWGGSAAKTSVAGGSATVDVTTTGKETYMPQLVQYGVALDKGMKYKLSFKASADVARKIEVSFQQSVDPWGAYATKEFDITTTEKEYAFIFAMEEDSDDAAQFAFNLGQATGAVKISDVKLVFTTAEPGSETDPGTTSFGSMVQGVQFELAVGSFQVFDMQGKSLGLVEVAAGTSLKDALKAKFQQSGVYMVRQGNRLQKVSVSR
ncbi:Carbohydrate binding domain-containing protein [Fibrobacter sp. UWH9]|uniref:glycoside hydrolase family 11 protein n=1 Tax=unclassified Fibrobacter TaxID=2634177 RepID=UPI000911BD4B|nr:MULTISPECIES: glycoside hydrolase family 11 protein [unclassified Fibrobacter]SHG78379.1 Carbohydrate binding domain-containing protein [Fibrobacter sp. UWH9]SHL82223.1 Carbohydrate binding domain-containing protein [Fibrobacter sp. UWH5]